MGHSASSEFDTALAANLRRLAEELAKDHADLASFNRPSGDIDVAEGRAAITAALAATATLADALRGGAPRPEK